MEPNNLESPTEQNTSNLDNHQPIKSIIPNKKRAKWLIPTLIFIIVLSLTTAGIFAYQNFKMVQEKANQTKIETEKKKQELNELTNKIEISPTITSITTPSATPSAIQKQQSITLIPTQPAKKDVYFAFSGSIYRDENCNGIKDNGEGLVNESAEVNVWKTDNTLYATMKSGNGTFSYANYINSNETLTLEITVVSPTGYKSNHKENMPSFTFNKDNVLANFEIPQVPNEFYSSCFPE